jgi:ubiquinone biosynthesis protein COQ9
MKVRERIATAVRLRLEQNLGEREAIRKGLTFLALPQHATLATKLLYRTVDAMWLAAGDRSTDYNFYTKRLLLAGVYSSTLLVWLDDQSDGLEKTWAFLERRIDNVLKVGGSIGKGMKRLLDLPDRLLEKRPRGLRSMR